MTVNQMFDYETSVQKVFDVVVYATDASGHFDWADVMIRLQDEDESDPVFTASEYNFEVPGSARAGDYIGIGHITGHPNILFRQIFVCYLNRLLLLVNVYVHLYFKHILCFPIYLFK